MSAPSRARAASLTGGDRSRDVLTSRSSSAASSQIVGIGGTAGSTSGSGAPSRADQIIYRFYLKTVGVLVDGRVTHFTKGEPKKDRWFNLSIPDTDVHKADLSIYRSVSEYPPLPKALAAAGASRSTVPPLLIAFILDTNDIPAGQTLTWNRGGQRVAIDPCLVHNPAGGRKPGIVLERWTFRVTNVADNVSDGSEMAPPTAYRLGIIHFRALYAYIRLLPAYRLFRRLRRLNTGLRLGIKLWGPEGYDTTEAGLAEAWEVMERDLVGIDVPLERMIPSQEESSGEEPLGEYTFAPLELFGSTYELGVSYRPQADFDVEDMESLLSERFVDMDEEWFTPTVARHRIQSEARAAASTGTSYSSANPAVAGTSPRVQPVTTRPTSTVPPSVAPSRSSVPKEPGSLGAGKWTALTEGLPFASGVVPSSGDSGSSVTPSPTGTTIPYRRLSAHSLQPFRSISASPSTSIIRGAGGVPFPTSVGARGAAPSPLPGSLTRTSEFLSSSGRSFTHAQMANMMQSHASPAPEGSPPFAPSSLSFTKQVVREPLASSTTSPFVPSSLDREGSLSGSHLKRYSASSITQRRLTGSSGSPVETLPSSLLRRQSTRESGLRHSIDEPRDAQPGAPDNDEVHAFLRALDSWTPPASIASVSPRATTTAPLVATSTTTPIQESATSSMSGGSHTSPRGLSVSGSQSQQASVSHASINRTPLTRAHVDDMLKRMVGSFSVAAEQTPSHSVVSSGVPSRPPSQPSRPPSQPSRPPSQPSRPPSQPSRPTSHSSRPASHLTSRGESYTSERSITITGPGLLSASRPSPPQAGLSPRSKDSPLPGSSLRHGSFPRSGALPFAAPAHLTANPAGAGAIGAARSLPAATREEARDALTPLSTPLSPPSGLSPQTTGSTDTSRRRGPVLVRGGFGTASAKATSPSPSHSPVRAYRSALHADELAGHGHQGTVSSSGNPIRRSATLTSMGSGAPRIGRTAPSSFSADADTELDAATGAAGTTGGMGGSALGGALASALGRSRSRAREPASTSTSPTASTSASEASPVVEGLMARLALADRRRDERERRRDDFYPGP